MPTTQILTFNFRSNRQYSTEQCSRRSIMSAYPASLPPVTTDLSFESEPCVNIAELLTRAAGRHPSAGRLNADFGTARRISELSRTALRSGENHGRFCAPTVWSPDLTSFCCSSGQEKCSSLLGLCTGRICALHNLSYPHRFRALGETPLPCQGTTEPAAPRHYRVLTQRALYRRAGGGPAYIESQPTMGGRPRARGHRPGHPRSDIGFNGQIQKLLY